MDSAIWNLLHDGSIESIEGDVPGNLKISVAIQYLRDMFDPPGGAFKLELASCDLIELEGWNDGAVIADPAAIGVVGPEILSGSVAEDHVAVICDGYTLRLRYNAIHIHIDTGAPITVEQLDSAADRYWTQWETGGARQPS